MDMSQRQSVCTGTVTSANVGWHGSANAVVPTRPHKYKTLFGNNIRPFFKFRLYLVTQNGTRYKYIICRVVSISELHVILI